MTHNFPSSRTNELSLCHQKMSFYLIKLVRPQLNQFSRISYILFFFLTCKLDVILCILPMYLNYAQLHDSVKLHFTYEKGPQLLQSFLIYFSFCGDSRIRFYDELFLQKKFYLSDLAASQINNNNGILLRRHDKMNCKILQPKFDCRSHIIFVLITAFMVHYFTIQDYIFHAQRNI